MKQKLIVIAGPTASGKTAIAVEVAKRIGGEIVSCDSMQLYRGMEVLSAAPTEDEKQGVPHHMIGIADPAEKYTAARYRDEARCVIDAIAARGRMPVLCGGTGLYINAVTRPMEFSQTCDEALRKQLMVEAETPDGRLRLHEQLRAIDPEAAQKLHPNDVRRVTRAIEVFRLTGRTQTEQAKLDAEREGDYDERVFAPEWPRETLYTRIEKRVDLMLEAGLVDEVRTLMRDEQAHPTALQAIGYKEIAAALEGRMEMGEAVDLVKQLTRNYAKKQMTWFRRDARVRWLAAENSTVSGIADSILAECEGWI